MYIIMKVAAVSMQPDLLLSMLPTGCNTGIIVDIGEAESRCIAIAYGRIILSSLKGYFEYIYTIVVIIIIILIL